MTTYEAVKTGSRVRVRIREEKGTMARPRREARVELITDTGILTAVGNERLGIDITIP